MANPLARFDSSTFHGLAGKNSGLAVSASSGNSHIHQEGRVLVAIWGTPRFREPRLAELSCTTGLAKTLGDQWRTKGEQVFEDLAGSYALCIVHEHDEGNEAVLATD